MGVPTQVTRQNTQVMLQIISNSGTFPLVPSGTCSALVPLLSVLTVCAQHRLPNKRSSSTVLSDKRTTRRGVISPTPPFDVHFYIMCPNRSVLEGEQVAFRQLIRLEWWWSPRDDSRLTAAMSKRESTKRSATLETTPLCLRVVSTSYSLHITSGNLSFRSHAQPVS